MSKSAPTSTLRIAVFGGSGAVGRRLVAEAARRGHRVTAIARRRPEPGTHDKIVKCVTPDVQVADDLAQIIAEHDIVLSALRPSDGQEALLVELTARVVDIAQRMGRRFIVVGGAAPLRMPDDDKHSVLTAPGFLPESSVRIAAASQEQHDWIMTQLGNLGTYLCPPAMLQPGERTGMYRVGGDTLLVDEAGDSAISMEDFAVATVDEAEQPAHFGRKFTVAY